MHYKDKYIKYKIKYLNLKGGFPLTPEQKKKVDYYDIELNDDDDISDDQLNDIISENPIYKLNNRIQLAEKYGIELNDDDDEDIFQDKIFQSSKFQEELKDTDNRYEKSKNYEYASYFNVLYNHNSDSDSDLYERISKSKKYIESLSKIYSTDELKSTSVGSCSKATVTLRALKSDKTDSFLSSASKSYRSRTPLTTSERYAASRYLSSSSVSTDDKKPTLSSSVIAKSEPYYKRFSLSSSVVTKNEPERRKLGTPKRVDTPKSQSGKSFREQFYYRSRQLSNYELVNSKGDGNCLYWSLSSALSVLQGRESINDALMISIKERIKGEYTRVLKIFSDLYPDLNIGKLNSEQLYNFALTIDTDTYPELEVDKNTLTSLALGLGDTSLMNLGTSTPNTAEQYIGTFNRMYGGQAEIQMFVKIYNIPVLSISNKNRKGILYRTREMEQLTRFEMYRNPKYGILTDENEFLFRTLQLGYEEISEEQRRRVIVISREPLSAHYDYYRSVDGRAFIVPDNFIIS